MATGHDCSMHVRLSVHNLKYANALESATAPLLDFLGGKAQNTSSLLGSFGTPGTSDETMIPDRARPSPGSELTLLLKFSCTMRTMLSVYSSVLLVS